MKRFHWMLLGLLILCLAVVPLAGCVSKSEYEALQAEYTALAEENTGLNTELEQVRSDLADVQSDLANLQAEYDTVSAELAEIKEVYPPGDFSSVRELEDWLLSNDVSEKPITKTAEAWYGRALEVQEDALADGYVISVDYDGPDEQGKFKIFCITIINGAVYFWDPETDEVHQDTSLANVK